MVRRVRLSQLILLSALSACESQPMGPRVASIDLSRTRIQFDALGDTLTFGATARTVAGSVLPADSLDYSVGDHTVATLELNAKLISVGAGQTTLTVRDPDTDVTGQALIIVDQIATTLAVRVDSGESFVRLPAGAHLPLACEAFDKNGFPMRQDTVLVSSLKGTVTAGPCAGARIQRSGYDTLVFSLNAARVRVPVIIASRPDSVGVVAAAQPLTTVERERFVGEDLSNPLILALRPLVQDILAAYRNPTSNLDRARAIRDWVARTAVHPSDKLHPAGSTSNATVLPSGKTWADVNVVSMGKLDADRNYWGAVGMDGYAMLNRLLGTLDPGTGLRLDDGFMVKVQGARYGIRDVASYRYVQCSYQDIMLNALWAAAGLHGMLISTVGHDPAAVFIPELGQWIYEDPTYNEDYKLDGVGGALSATDLLALSSAGQGRRLRASKVLGPSFDPTVYVAGETYINQGHPDGMTIMGSQLNARVVGVSGTGGWPLRNVQIDVPQLNEESPFNDPIAFARVTAAEAFPMLGVVVQEFDVEDSVFVAQLSSIFPDHRQFERRLNGGGWESIGQSDVLPVGQCRVEYRSVDALGNVSATTVMNIWAPRPQGFLESGLPTSVRRQARYCI